MDPIKIFGSKEKAEQAYQLLPPSLQTKDKDSTLTNLFLAFLVAQQNISTAEANRADEMEPQKIETLGQTFFNALSTHSKDEAWFQKLYTDSEKKAQTDPETLRCLEVLGSFDIFKAIGGEYKAVKEEKKEKKDTKKKEIEEESGPKLSGDEDSLNEEDAGEEIGEEEESLEGKIDPDVNQKKTDQVLKAADSVIRHVRDIAYDDVQLQYATTFVKDCVLHMKAELEGFEARLIKSQKNPDANFVKGKEGSENYRTFCKKLDETIDIFNDPKATVDQMRNAYGALKKECETFLQNSRPFDSLNKAERQAYIAATNLSERHYFNDWIMGMGITLLDETMSRKDNAIKGRNLAGQTQFQTITEMSSQMERIILDEEKNATDDAKKAEIEEKRKTIERGKQEYALLQDKVDRIQILITLEQSADADNRNMDAKTTPKELARDVLLNQCNDMLMDKRAHYSFDQMVDLSFKTKPEFLDRTVDELAENPVFIKLVEQANKDKKMVGKTALIGNRWRAAQSRADKIEKTAMEKALKLADTRTLEEKVSSMKTLNGVSGEDGLDMGYNALADMVMMQMLADPKHKLIRQVIGMQIGVNDKKVFPQGNPDPFDKMDALVQNSMMAADLWNEIYANLKDMNILDKPNAKIGKMINDGSLHEKLTKKFSKSDKQELIQAVSKPKEKQISM